MMLDRVAQKHPSRTIRLLDSMIRGLLRRVVQSVKAGNGERITGFRSELLDTSVVSAVRDQAPTSQPVLARLIRLTDRLRKIWMGDPKDAEDRMQNYYRLSVFFGDLQESLAKLYAYSIAGLADENNGNLGTVLKSTETSPCLTRAIASGLILSPDSASDQAIDWLLTHPERLALKNDFGSDEVDLSREIILRHSKTCSVAEVARLEAVLLKHMPLHEKEHYQYILETHLASGKWGHWCGGRYIPLINPIGKAQHALLGAIAEGRRSPQVVERLKIWDSKFGGPAVDNPRMKSRGGLVGSPVPSDRIDRITDRQWLDIVAKRWPRNWKQVGPDRIVESSPENFAEDMKSIATKQPRRFVQMALRFQDDAPSVYLSRLWYALSDRATDTESCSPAELDALINRTIASRDRDALVAACYTVQNHPNAQWGKAIWALLDIAVAHEDPLVNECNGHKGNEDKKHSNIENVSLNCVRGVAAAALAALAWDNTERCENVAARVVPLASDPHPAVRIAAAQTAYAIYTVNRDTGMRLLLNLTSMPSVAFPTISAFGRFRAEGWNCLGAFFRDAVRRLRKTLGRVEADSQRSRYEKVLAGRWVNRLAGRGRWSHRGALRELFSRMARSTEPEVAKLGAQWVTAERFQFGKCRREYRRCRTGTEMQRRGIAEMLVHLVGDDHSDRAAVEADLVRLFDDPSESVRAAASDVFRTHGVLKSEVGVRLASKFVPSLAFAENAQDLIWSLSHEAVDLVKYSSVIFASADRFATELAEQARSMQNRSGMSGRELSSLLLRLYDASTKQGNRDLGSQCLDRWDNMLRSRVGESDIQLDSYFE